MVGSPHQFGTRQCRGFGTSRDEALTKMRNELQYRIEWCPCSGVSGDTVELQVKETGHER
jgi:hypothetical protein